MSVYATIPDDGTTERTIHDKLASYRVKGEWFDVPLSVVNTIIVNTPGHKFFGDKVKFSVAYKDRSKWKGKRKKRTKKGRPSKWCRCGCGLEVSKRALYANDACRQRAYRERKKAA